MSALVLSACHLWKGRTSGADTLAIDGNVINNDLLIAAVVESEAHATRAWPTSHDGLRGLRTRHTSFVHDRVRAADMWWESRAEQGRCAQDKGTLVI